jgi:hypothetical protein
MAGGLLDQLPAGGIFDYLRQFDKASEAFMPQDYWKTVSGNYDQSQGAPLAWVLDKLKEVDKQTSGYNSVMGGLVSKPDANQPSNLQQHMGAIGIAPGTPPTAPGLNAPQSGDINGWAPPQTAQPPLNVPQSGDMGGWNPPQAAQQQAGPTGAYEFGTGSGVMVPYFGQPQTAQAPIDEASGQRRGVGGVAGLQINPQGNPAAAAAVTPGTTSTAEDKTMAFIDRLSPDYASRYRQTKQQQQTAVNLARFFQGQGMAPQQAAAIATVAAGNPKVLEEILKPHPNMEAALASQYGPKGGASGDKMQQYMDFVGKKTATEKGAEVAGKTAAEAQIALPGGIADINQSMQVIKELRNHEGRKSIGWHGVTANIPPEMLRGSKAFAAVKLEDQLKARTFTDQVKTMVGMGALSNAEGSKITDAIARIDRGLPRDEYDAALDFIETTMKNGIDKMSQKAGQPAPFGFKGNDGWTTAPNGARIRQR